MLNDIHSVSKIVPANYEFVIDYSLATTYEGFPVPAINMDEVLKLKAEKTFAKHGSIGKCTVCGASFKYGSIWVHTETGEHIHIGHTCEDKYGMLVDLSGFEMKLHRERANAYNAGLRKQRELLKEAFLSNNPALQNALMSDHHILSDLNDQLYRRGSLSEKQIELAFKIVKQLKDRQKEQEELSVSSPEGKIEVEGVVINTKSEDTQWGEALKMTVKVPSGDGYWIAYGTLPAKLADWCYDEENHPGEVGIKALRGKTVKITGTFKKSKNDHISYFSRPRGEIVA